MPSAQIPSAKIEPALDDDEDREDDRRDRREHARAEVRARLRRLRRRARRAPAAGRRPPRGRDISGLRTGAGGPANSVERRLERLAREVGPELVAEHELRVGGLPQQVVGQPLLAARADDQVGIVHLGRVQVRAELFLGGPREGSRRVDDLRPAAVVERHEQRDALVGARQLLGPRPCARPGARSMPSRRPMKRMRTPSSCSSGVSTSMRCAEHRHQRRHLLRRARPVLGRERVHGQLAARPKLDGVAQPRLHVVRAGLVARLDADSPRRSAQRPFPSVMIAT